MRCRTVGPTLLAPVALFALAVLVAVAGCSQSEPDRTVDVSGTDTGCRPATAVAPAGVIRFRLTNDGSEANELYVLNADGDTLAEKEDIGPGTTGSVTVELEQGSYRLRCKPGQRGDGIVTPFSVTG